MRLVVLTAAVAALTFAGCKKEQPAPAEPAPQEEQAATEPTPEAEPEPAPEKEEPVKVDAAVLGRYADYQRELLVVLRDYIQKVSKTIEGTDKDSTVQVAGAVHKVGKLAEVMDEKEQELRKKHDLSAEQVDAARDLVLQVIQGRMLLKSSGQDGETIVAQARAQLKNAPEDQRASMEAEIAKMEDTFKRISNAQDARDRYGDAAVDAVLAKEAEFQKLQNDMMGMLAEAK